MRSVMGTTHVAVESLDPGTQGDRTLIRERDLASAILDTLGALVVVFSREGRVIRFNRACERVTGLALSEVCGRYFWDIGLIPADQIPGARAKWDELASGHFPNSHENAWLHRDGSARTIAWENTAILDADGATELIISTGIDVTERRQVEAALAREQAILASVIQATDVALVLVDRDFVIQWVNDAYVARVGKTRPELVGKDNFAIFPNAESEAIFRQVRETGTPVFFKDKPFTFPGEPNAITYWDWSLAPTKDTRGEVVGLVLSFRETTRYKEAELALRRSEEQLREADRRKDEFLATLSHELRNPLAPISNAVELLRLKGPPDPPLQWCRDLIERQVRNMARLLDDLLDVSRISRNKLELRRQLVDLTSVLEVAIETSQPLIDKARQTLSVELPSTTAWVDGDPVRLAQVFANLLNNASKYTPEHGAITLAAIVEGPRVRVSVRDTGIGFAPDAVPRLFDLFWQERVSSGSAEGGLGIGLSLAKGLVSLHGGTIRAHSEGRGRGSEFVVELPLHEAPKAALRVPSNELETSQVRVLVIDDNADSADTLAELLRMLGNDVRTAYSGEDGLAIAESFRPDVVLLDVGMPGMDGLEVCRRLRTMPNMGGTLVVAMTGWGQAEDRRRTREAGFDTHLVKPVQASVVSRLIAEHAKQ